MLADLGQTWGPVVPLAVALVVCVAVGILIVKGHRSLTAAADDAAARAFDGIAISHAPAPGLVAVVFHTYAGFLVFTYHTEGRFWASQDDARLILSRLDRYNFTWGPFAYGALNTPVLSLANYWAQLRRIRRQAARE